MGIFTTHVVVLDDCVIVIKNVPCEECEQCGEKYYNDEVMEELEKIVDKAQSLPSEVYITDYSHRAA
ncbi:MAG: type II toxin-antitoxin system MqsA family antitoxin [Lachnospiraceae bacterium]|nr:type II toxin-antitoxin system MqsA family antitoxin [Lachnospiraceae bacterium]